MEDTARPDCERILRDFLREIACCLGRTAARHQLPDDAVWELVKGFDILHLRFRRRCGSEPAATGDLPPAHVVRPHPGIEHLIAKLDREGS